MSEALYTQEVKDILASYNNIPWWECCLTCINGQIPLGFMQENKKLRYVHCRLDGDPKRRFAGVSSCHQKPDKYAMRDMSVFMPFQQGDHDDVE